MSNKKRAKHDLKSLQKRTKVEETDDDQNVAAALSSGGSSDEGGGGAGITITEESLSAGSCNSSESPKRRCQLCIRRNSETTCCGVAICLTCNKFMSRQIKRKVILTPHEVAKMSCAGGGHLQSTCDLTRDRACKKCRLIQFAKVKIEMDKANNLYDPTSELSKSLLQIIDLTTFKVSEEKISLNEALRRKIARQQTQTTTSNSPTTMTGPQPDAAASQQQLVPLIPSPTDYHNISNEAWRWKVMRVDEAYTHTRYHLTAEYLKNLIPEGEDQFWGLVSWCIENLAQWKLPFAANLAGGLRTISHFDMCRLVESSYALMFYAETALPHRRDVVTSFSQLFMRMSHLWPEIQSMMTATKEVVISIRAWNPLKDEFAFLLALIVCISVCEQAVTPKTNATLKYLSYNIKSAAVAHLSQTYGPEVAQERFRYLMATLDLVTKLRDTRREALRRFYERHPQRALGTVYPVVASVCHHFKDEWNIDYFQDVPLQIEEPPSSTAIVRQNGVVRFAEKILETM